VSGESRSGRPIGREAASTRLRGSLDFASADASTVVLISGEAGVGKTRLLHSLLDDARERSWTVGLGRAQDYDCWVAYSSLQTILGSIDAGALGADAAAAHSELVDACARVGTRGGAAREAENATPAGVEVSPLVTALLRDATRRGPTLLALDDAHLADDESLGALALSVRHLAASPLVLALTARRDRMTSDSTFTATVGPLLEVGTVVDLEPLDEDHTAELLAAALGGEPDDRLVAYVYAASSGNPLFAHEALAALRESDALRVERGRHYLVGEQTSGVSRRGALLHRVFRQDGDARRLARAMSALRRVQLDQLDLLAEVSGVEPSRAHEAFDGLVRAAIIVRDETAWYEFAHPLVAEVLYEDLGPAERRRLHQRVGDRFASRESGSGMSPLELATHVSEAAVPGDREAIDVVLAAAATTRDAAPGSAARWYQRAIELLPPEAPERGGLHAAMNLALWKAGRPGQAVRAGRVALAALAPGAERDRTLGVVASATYAMGAYGEALELLDAELVSAVDPAPFVALQALLLAHLGEGERAQACRAEARHLAETTGIASRLTTYGFLLYVDQVLGDVASREATLEPFLAMTEEPEARRTPGVELGALESAAYVLATEGAVTEATELLERTTRRERGAGWSDLGGQRGVAAAHCAYHSGAWDDALDLIRSTAIGLEWNGLRNNVAWLRILEAEILTHRGELDDARELLEDPVSALECRLSEYARALCLGHIALIRGEHERARDAIARERTLLERSRMRVPLCRALDLGVSVHLATGSPREAQEWADALEHVAASSPTPDLVRLSEIATTRTHDDPAPAARALLSARRDGARLSEARAHAALGAIGSDPQGNLTAAWELFDSMGAVVATREVAAQAKQRGVRLPARRRTSGARGEIVPLTAREQDLVKLVSQGLTNRSISQVLHYSPKTVEIYLSRLYKKVGCRSRVELVVAAERGELDVAV
jgi:DNA-binding NarL/FixJ family response regulator